MNLFKLIKTTFIIFIFSFIYHSPILSANNRESSKKWQDLELKKVVQPKNIFAKRIDEILPEPQASLLNGMIFGIKGSMPKDFFNALKKTGVLHIIALSGTNISILINAVFGSLTPLAGRRKACLFAIFLIIIFIWFVGPSASVVRAGIMGGISLLAGYFGRQYYGVISLMLAIFLMIIASPKVVTDIGFQLSFMATLGIMLFATQKQVQSSEFRVQNQNYSSSGGRRRRPESRSSLIKDKFSTRFARSNNNLIFQLLKSLIEGFKSDLRVTLSAQVFTLPILIINFGEISLVSPLTNILIAPVVPAITTAGLLAAIIVFFIKPIGVIFLWSLWVLLSYFVAVIKLTSLIPLAAINVPKIGWGMGVLYYLIVLFLILRKRVRIKF